MKRRRRSHITHVEVKIPHNNQVFGSVTAIMNPFQAEISELLSTCPRSIWRR
jgi:hypothetical protein